MMTDKRMRRGAANILLFAAVLAFAAALFIVVTGGVDAPPLVLRNPVRPLIAGLALVSLSWLIARGEFSALARRVIGSDRLPSRIAVLAALVALTFSIAWASRAAGGSDSSCYVLQAEALADGHATLVNPVAGSLRDVPNAVFAPAGFVAGREYGAAVPICAPGLSLVMAAAYLVHPSAVFLVVPMTAGALVWLTFIYGRRVDDAVTGACAAVLTACSPIVLYQAVQPMSDVPAAAAWLAALVATSPLGAGVCASIAVLIRPNLALLLPLLLWQHQKRGQPPIVVLTFTLAAAPGFLTLLALNAARYGSPVASGYGDTGALFAWTHVTANAPRYARWLIETQTPFVLLAIAAPWVLKRDAARARLAWLVLGCVFLLVATYLAYTVFDDWWYLRFLLPVLPLVLGLSVAVARAAVRWVAPPAEIPVTAVLCTVLALFYVTTARSRHAMDLQALESRFRLTGESAARTLPLNAVVLAAQETGSIRFHGHRDTIAWDAIPPDALDATIAALRQHGRVVFLALEDAEETPFRARFAGQRTGALDWPPLTTIRAPVRARFYDTSR
jgi:hypothetical protein